MEFYKKHKANFLRVFVITICINPLLRKFSGWKVAGIVAAYFVLTEILFYLIGKYVSKKSAQS